MDGVFQRSFRVSPPLFGTAAGRPPCVFFLSSSRHSRLLWLQTSPGLSPDDGAPRPPPRRPDRAVSSVQTAAEGAAAHVRGVYFVVKRGRGSGRLDGAGWGEMRQERRQRGLVRTFQLAGKRRGRGVQGGGGGGGRGGAHTQGTGL